MMALLKRMRVKSKAKMARLTSLKTCSRLLEMRWSNSQLKSADCWTAGTFASPSAKGREEMKRVGASKDVTFRRREINRVHLFVGLENDWHVFVTTLHGTKQS